MNIRIALLVIGSLMGGGSSAAWADAMKPLDPDQAPIAAVDRFSDKAVIIQVRTADNHLHSGFGVVPLSALADIGVYDLVGVAAAL